MSDIRPDPTGNVLLVLSPEHHAALLRAIPSAATQGAITLRTNDELVGALHAAPDAGPRYLLVAREIETDGRDDLDFETHETRDDLVTAVIKYARQYRDELRVFDRGVEIEGEPEKWPEVRKAIDADRAAAEAQLQSQFVERRRAEYLRLKAEFDSSSGVSVDVLRTKLADLEFAAHNCGLDGKPAAAEMYDVQARLLRSLIPA